MDDDSNHEAHDKETIVTLKRDSRELERPMLSNRRVVTDGGMHEKELFLSIVLCRSL